MDSGLLFLNEAEPKINNLKDKKLTCDILNGKILLSSISFMCMISECA